jgi:hypothetical protein
MTEQHTDHVDTRQTIAGNDSHRSPPKPRPKNALVDGANRVAKHVQNELDPGATVPLHVRPVLTYAEVAALGIAPERTLRRLVATGHVRRAVIRTGRRVRFVREILIEELLGAGA